MRDLGLPLADQVGPLCNVVISSVPGARETLYLAGAELTALVPVSAVSHKMGLNMTVTSYRDRALRSMNSLSRLAFSRVDRLGSLMER